MVEYSNYCSYRVVARTCDRVGYCNYDHAMLRVAWHENVGEKMEAGCDMKTGLP